MDNKKEVGADGSAASASAHRPAHIPLGFLRCAVKTFRDLKKHVVPSIGESGQDGRDSIC